jgi:pimeloyl-ACP methyl ester carboxylesterase
MFGDLGVCCFFRLTQSGGESMKRAKSIQIAKGIIEYSLEGDGAPVLMLHGGHSSCRETFGREALLKAGFAVLTPSRAGYGQSSVTVGKTATEAAESMVRLLDALQLDKVAVIAISAGGLTGLYLAATYPERVSKLVLESAVTGNWLSPEDGTYKMAQKLFHPRTEQFTWAQNVCAPLSALYHSTNGPLIFNPARERRHAIPFSRGCLLVSGNDSAPILGRRLYA